MILTKMSTTQQSTTQSTREFITKFQKKRQYYLGEKMRDGRNWPIIPDPAEIAYENWKTEVMDPTTGQYYQSHNGDTAHYNVHQIIRLKRVDGSEKLYSIGQLVGYNQFKDEKTHRCHSPEIHEKPIFKHETIMDTKTKKLKRVTTAISGTEYIYELDFTTENLDRLYAQKASDYVQLVVKEEQTNEPHSINGYATQAQTFSMFRNKPFSYLYNADFLTAEQKEENRKNAESALGTTTNSQQQGGKK